MKVLISDTGDAGYRFAINAEDNNEALLLELLTGRQQSPFSNQEDGVVAVVRSRQPMVQQKQVAPKKRVFSLATRRKLAASQRARWAKIKAAGKQLKIAKKAA